jgi:telomere-associated protein RIF1
MFRSFIHSCFVYLLHQVTDIVTSIDHVLTCGGFQSQTIEYEAINALHQLLVQVPAAMGEIAVQWGRLVYGHVMSPAPKVCEHALAVFELGLSHMINVRKKILKSFLPDLKKALLPEMLKEFTARPHFILRVWNCCIDLLGPTLHRGILINDMLKVPEQGFRSSLSTVQVSTFRSWRHLISVFTLSKGILTNAKRLRLCLTPLVGNLNRCRCIETDEARITTWWHLVESLGAELHKHFADVCHPLLCFCFPDAAADPATLPSVIASPNSQSILSTPKNQATDTPSVLQLKMASPQQDACLDTLPSYQLMALGIEAFNCLISNQITKEEGNVRLRCLSHPAISSEDNFVQHSPLFFRVMISLLQHDQFLPDFQQIWTHLVAMVTEVVKSENVQRKDIRDILSNCLGLCHFSMQSGLSLTEKLGLIHDVMDFPSEVLISTVKVPESDELLTGVEVLAQLILNKEVLTTGSDVDIEKIIADSIPKVISCCLQGISPLRHIRFLHSIVCQSAHCLRSALVCQLWLSMVTPFTDYVIRTNDINEGTSLEPSFITSYNLLLFLFRHVIDISQEMKRALVKSWNRLYKAITNAVALGTNLQGNQCVEDISFGLLKLFEENEQLRSGSLLCVLSECLCVVVTPAYHGVLLKKQADSSREKGMHPTLGLSMKDKTRKSSGNSSESVTYLVKLIGMVLHEALNSEKNTVFMCSKVGQARKLTPNDATVCTIIDVLSNLFNHTNGAHTFCIVLKELALPISQLLKKTFKDKQMTSRVTLLCSHVLTCVQRGHDGPYDTRLLDTISPYLEEMLCHSEKQIRNQTAIFWNATFGKSEFLEYPPNLRPKLSCLKAKMPIILPGWTDDIHTNDMQRENSLNVDDASQMAVTTDITACISSPSRLRGSFLHKALATEKILMQSSPIKEALPRRSTRKKDMARRKLQLFDEEEEFVVVSPVAKKRRLLTEHQKEVMREKKASAIPTMYNLIEDSQDTTQFSESIDPDQLSKNTQKPTPQPSCKDCTPHSDNSTLKQLPDDIIEETTPNSSEVNLLTVVPDSEMDTHNGIVAGYEETGTSGLAVSVCNKSHQISDGGIDGQLNGDCLELDDEIGPTTKPSANIIPPQSNAPSSSYSSRLKQTTLHSSPIQPGIQKWINMPNSTPISKLVCVPVSSKSPSPISPINGSPTGILKKQGSVDGSELLSPSKVRHVSFAFPLEEQREVPLSPKIALKRQMKKANRSLALPFQSVSDLSLNDGIPSETINLSPLIDDSAKSVHMDVHVLCECVYPMLMDSQVDISHIVPSLSSTNSHGLSQLFRARGIRTIGNLSALSESELQTLPIKPPKVCTVKTALEKFEKRQSSLKGKQSTPKPDSEMSDSINTSCNDDSILAEVLDTSLTNPTSMQSTHNTVNDIAVQTDTGSHMSHSSVQASVDTCSVSIQSTVQILNSCTQTVEKDIAESSTQTVVSEISEATETEWMVCHIPGILQEMSRLVGGDVSVLDGLTDDEMVQTHLSLLNLMTVLGQRLGMQLVNRNL